jgi:nicotinamide-nucleotide amidase
MKAEIIGIGTEILLGQIVNTNSAYLSGKLAEIGIDCYNHTTVGDNHLRLYAAITQALGRSDIVITTGGLGPTLDDITLEIISKVAQKPLILKKEIIRLISGHFKKRHIKMARNNLRQGYIPKGAAWLKNDIGTAPGIIIKIGKRLLVALPGPPREMQPMVEKDLLPYLKKSAAGKSVILSRTLKTTGLAESQLHEKIKQILKLSGNTTVGIYAHPSQIDLKITVKAKDKKKAKRKICCIEKKIRKSLGKLIFAVDTETLEGHVADLLRNKTIAIAESCTGGLVSDRLTDIAGISGNLLLAVVAYSNKAKMELLDIPEKKLKTHGAVSMQVAKTMAKNIRVLAGSDIGIAITGIAGPTGATKKKPVGFVHIALSTSTQIITKKCYFIGDRKTIKFRSSQAVLDMLRYHLMK